MAASPIDRRAIPAGARVSRWPARDGWALRSFDWPAARVGAGSGAGGLGAAPRGSILFQTGRGDVFEKYLEAFAHWHRQGWSIRAFDWRGQGGSGRLTSHPQCGHIDRFETFIDDLAAFHAEWRADSAGPRVVMGHSMGGHLVLRALVEGAIDADAAVLIAPMLGVRSPLGALSERAARLMGALGDPARPAWRGNEKPYTTETRADLLTHDPDRYADELWWQANQPETLTGPPSWHWLAEAFASMRRLERDPRLAALATPLLMLVADADGLVDPRVARRVAARLPRARVERFGRESAHEILREVDPVRLRALGAIDQFLAAEASAEDR